MLAAEYSRFLEDHSRVAVSSNVAGLPRLENKSLEAADECLAADNGFGDDGGQPRAGVKEMKYFLPSTDGKNGL